MAFEHGDLVSGKYTVLEEVGKGGMGVVYKVTDPDGHELALKVCEDSEPEAVRRFARETRIMASISHPHVMRVLDYDLEGDPPYFTMPLASGSLAEEISCERDFEAALEAFMEICAGVQAIHNAGVTHRDIKPDNAMRMMDGTLVVADLGLAKFDIRDTTVVTRSHVFLGTQAYCAPEQMMAGGSKEANAQTDVFQLGKTLYHLITGEVPALIERDKLPAGLGTVVTRATNPEPARRYAGVSQLMDAVSAYRKSTAPGANPEYEFEVALAEANELLEQNEYSTDNVEKICALITAADGDPDVVLERVRNIPDRLLEVIAANLPSSLSPVLEVYCRALEGQVHTYNFSYAEVVAAKMRLVYEAADTADLKGLAGRATLVAAVHLNRFAAMDVLDKMLTSPLGDEEAAEVARALDEHLDLYRAVAERVPRSRLPEAIAHVRDKAVSE